MLEDGANGELHTDRFCVSLLSVAIFSRFTAKIRGGMWGCSMPSLHASHGDLQKGYPAMSCGVFVSRHLQSQLVNFVGAELGEM